MSHVKEKKVIIERVALSDIELTVLADVARRITDLSGSTERERLTSLWRALNFGGGQCRVNVTRLRSFRGTTVADLCQHLESHCSGPVERPFDPEDDSDIGRSQRMLQKPFVCRTYVNFVPTLTGTVEAEAY